VDILGDGDLDLDDESLALLDWVIVSIHSRFEQTPEAATARVMKAIAHPAVHAFGHPTGRLIQSRKPVPFELERVFEAAAARGVAMEMNSAPDRLDLSDVNARAARVKGCRFVIDTDAHAAGQLDLMKFGVFQARRAGLTRDDVWNARDFAGFDGWRREKTAKGAVAMPAPAARPAPPAPTAIADKAANGRAARDRSPVPTGKAKPEKRKARPSAKPTGSRSGKAPGRSRSKG
jgi:DNA polymerase (family 10)